MSRGDSRSLWRDAEAVRAHHREVRDNERMRQLGQYSPAYHQALQESLARLAEQGYGMEEVGVMFGVSRERVRQWAEKYGLTDRFRVLGKGTKPRVWDAERHQFVAQTWVQFTDEAHRAGLRTRRRASHRRQKERRRQFVAALHALSIQLGRTPTSLETQEAIGKPWAGILSSFCGRRFWRKASRGRHMPYRSLHRRFYRLAGLTPRGRGHHGHREKVMA